MMKGIRRTLTSIVIALTVGLGSCETDHEHGLPDKYNRGGYPYQEYPGAAEDPLAPPAYQTEVPETIISPPEADSLDRQYERERENYE